jgi:hypothetical protein
MTRLFVNIGRNFSVRPQDIVGTIAGEADIPGRSIGAIDILDSYTFVDVPADYAERVIEALKRSGIKNRPVNVEIAQPGAGRPGRGPRPGPRGPHQRPFRRGSSSGERMGRPAVGRRGYRSDMREQSKPA